MHSYCSEIVLCVYRYTYSDLRAWDSQIHDCGLGYLVVYVLYVCLYAGVHGSTIGSGDGWPASGRLSGDGLRVASSILMVCFFAQGMV